MPGRATTRSSRSSNTTTGRKSSAATLKSRASRSARASANAVEIPDEGPDTLLRTQICQIFNDAQNTTATQRKLTISLRKLQERCCFEQPEPKSGRQEDEYSQFDEGDFINEIKRCLLRVLNVKKSESAGDRVIRFFLMFLVHALEKDQAIFLSEDGTELVESSDMPSSRLITHIMTALLEFLTAKDKIVRFRATQLVAQIINSVNTIDDDVYYMTRIGFLKRLRDKEPSIRVQAALGLIRLAGDNDNDDGENEEDSDEEDTLSGLHDKLIDIMVNDSSAEVRRAVLQNLSVQINGLRKMLERARDTDPTVRRIVYNKILPQIDFRQLSLVEREKLLRWGLRDRDEGVRKAAVSLFCNHWIESCAAPRDNRAPEEKKPGETVPPNLDALCEMLERIEITSSGVKGGIAHEAMKVFWEFRPDYLKFVTFDHDFWKDLDPFQAFVARSLRDYSSSLDDATMRDMLEDKMPEISNFTWVLQRHLNLLIELVDKLAAAEDDSPEANEAQEDTDDQNFVVQQLLQMSLTFDYSDEVGRNQIFNIMRGAIARAQLPDECTKLAIDVLRECCGNRGESDFCQIAWEAIIDIEDIVKAPAKDEDVDDSFHSAHSDISDDSVSTVQSNKGSDTQEEVDPVAEVEKQEREIAVYSKCLLIARCTLQNVRCDPESESSLENMLQNLIEPSLFGRRSKTLREGGAICLGLCALLSKNIALNNLEAFFRCYTEGHPELQAIAVQALVDIVITHPSLLTPPKPDSETSTQEDEPRVNALFKPLTKMLLKAFRSHEEELSLLACTGASKLLLRGLFPPDFTADLLNAFVLAYFDPDMSSRPAIRQALSYFLPVFCHSKLENALLMAQISVPLMSKLLLMKEEFDEEANEMVGWPVITAHLSEWTDGRQVVGAMQSDLDGKTSITQEAEEPHVYLATEILERALTNTCPKDERKPLLALLNKLNITFSGPASDNEALLTLHSLATEAVEGNIGMDATQRNHLIKLELGLTKRLGEAELATQAEGIDEDTIKPEPMELGETASTNEMENEDEDTMMAGLQDEGTRIPLDYDEEDDDEARTMRTVTESDIVDSLLESEMDE